MSPFKAESFLPMVTEEEIKELWIRERFNRSKGSSLLPRFRCLRLRICCYKMGSGPRVGLPWAPPVMCRFLTSYRKDFTTLIQVILRVCH